MRVVQDEQLGSRVEVFCDHCNGIKKVLVVAQRYGYHVGACESDCVVVDGKRWIGYYCGVAGAEHCKAHVAEALFGAQADQNLVVGVETNAVLFEIFGRDLAAEVAAVENVIARLSPRTTRVGIVTFSHRSWVDAPLTHDYEEVRLALGDILSRGPEGGTNMKSGLLRGSIELIGTKSAASTRRKGAERVLVFVTDGRPTLPYAAGPFSSDGRNVREAVRSAEKAAKRGVRMHSFAVGKEAM